MNNFRLPIFIICIFIFYGCEEKKGEGFFPRSSFLNQFPDKEIDLTKKLGNRISLSTERDTLHFIITFDKSTKTTTIIDSLKRDTIFSGKVSKYKGLYYFSRQIADSAYWISAVKIKRNYISGLGTDWGQMLNIDEELDFNETSILHTLIDKSKPKYNLRTDKKILSKYFERCIDSLPSLTRLYELNSQELINDSLDIEKDVILENIAYDNLIKKYYPNPVEDILNIETHNNSEYQLTVFDEQQEIKIKEKFTGNKKLVSMSHLPKGIYFLRLISEKLKKVQSVKVLVQ